MRTSSRLVAEVAGFGPTGYGLFRDWVALLTWVHSPVTIYWWDMLKGRTSLLNLANKMSYLTTLERLDIHTRTFHINWYFVFLYCTLTFTFEAFCDSITLLFNVKIYCVEMVGPTAHQIHLRGQIIITATKKMMIVTRLIFFKWWNQCHHWLAWINSA